MSKIQQTLDSLQPYVIGIRYLEGTPIVDAVFKDGWTVPEDTKIKKVKGNDELNYYMLLSEVDGIGLDELLAFVEKTIKLNVEREKKNDLFKVKANELREIFKKNTLSKLKHLNFTFTEEDLTPDLEDFGIDEIEEEIIPEPLPTEQYVEEEIQPEPLLENTPYLDENGVAIEPDEEEQEMLMEEARAERNRKFLENKKQKTETKKVVNKVELPPKRKVEVPITTIDYDSDCECGPDEYCNKCMDNKGY